MVTEIGGYRVSARTAADGTTIRVSVDGHILDASHLDALPGYDECIDLIHRYQAELESVGYGERIRGARKMSGLTQQEAADIIGCKIQQYQRWECGAVIPSVKYGRRIADTFGVSMDSIF